MAERRQPKATDSDATKSNTMSIPSLLKKPAQDFVRVYASVIHSIATPYDIALIFGQPIVGTNEEPYIEQKVSVALSWQAAKSLRQLLDRAIASYEEEWGEIRVPPPDQPASA